jgi:hypothetical protein
MFLVSLTNQAYTKSFKSANQAIVYMERCGFEATLMTTDGNIIATFSPIGGFTNVRQAA